MLYADTQNLEQARYWMYKAETATLSQPERAKVKLKRYQARIEIAANKLEQAASLLQGALDYYYQEKDIDNTGELVIVQAFLGLVETRRGNLLEAKTQLEQALELASFNLVKPDLAFILQNFAVLKEVWGKKSDALEYAHAALRLYEQLGMKRQIRETKEIIAWCDQMP